MHRVLPNNYQLALVLLHLYGNIHRFLSPTVTYMYKTLHSFCTFQVS